MFTVIFASFFPSKEQSTARANTLGSLGGLQGSLGGSLDGQLGTLPTLGGLHSGITSPNGLYPVGEAVNFQFNTLYTFVKKIYLLDKSGERVKELVNNPSGIDIQKEGFCYRFRKRGQVTLEVEIADIFGRTKTSKTSFQISEYAQSGKYCKPTYGGRIYLKADPEYKPEWEEDSDDPWDTSYAGGNGQELIWKGRKWKKEWTITLKRSIENHARELLDESFLPMNEIKKLCSGFSDASLEERRDFWATFMAAIAYPESGYKVDTVFLEPAPLNKNSVGLFQLSYDDTRHGRGCEINGEASLKDPETNIRCAVKIMRNQMEVRKTLWPKKFYYWSVLTTTKKYEVRSIFDAYKQNFLPFCK